MNEKLSVVLVRIALAEIGQDWTDAQAKANARFTLRQKVRRWWRSLRS